MGTNPNYSRISGDIRGSLVPLFNHLYHTHILRNPPYIQNLAINLINPLADLVKSRAVKTPKVSCLEVENGKS